MQQGFSVAVCTFNGSKRITQTIQSILIQKGISPNNFELLIIDNASTDNTRQVCASIVAQANTQVVVRIISEPKLGLIHAKLTALRQAKFNWLLLCDDDNELMPNYLCNALQIVQKNAGIGALGGKGIPKFEGQQPAWFNTYYSSYAVGAQHTVSGKIDTPFPAVYGAGSLIHVAAMRHIFAAGLQPVMNGRNNQQLTSGEDTEWCYLLQLAGYEIWYSDELQFFHALSANRLQFNYYVQLKKGIAAGAGLLFPYQQLLQQPATTVIGFCAAYIYRLVHLHAVLVKLQLQVLTNKPQTQQMQVGKCVVQSKAASFRCNFGTAYRQFIAIRSKLLTAKTT